MRLNESKKKPISVTAIHYNKNISLNKLLELLSTNKEEPVRYDKNNKNIYIKKKRGEISLKYGNWVIYEKNTDQCFWAIDNDIFLKTYTHVKGTVNTYRKNVYEVECIEFKSLADKDIVDVLEFLGYIAKETLEILQRDELIFSVRNQGYISILTLEGEERLYPSDILIKGIQGEYYPVKRENFDKVYEVIN
ncbi:hypothetical protein B6U56_09255 [Ligilactobacillus salivarius]|uniref:Uncharacterized protein n=1 Tax=Ligilactobacillus salivarius TaxID=1624 RepID=A0A1V9R8H3_9LACO|nr:hypothetical protein B6U56_09255 [Ligilactobacillus salivarius]